MPMVLIRVHEKMKKEYWKHRVLVRSIVLFNGIVRVYLLVHALIEDEINNGISAERVVGEKKIQLYNILFFSSR